MNIDFCWLSLLPFRLLFTLLCLSLLLVSTVNWNHHSYVFFTCCSTVVPSRIPLVTHYPERGREREVELGENEKSFVNLVYIFISWNNSYIINHRFSTSHNSSNKYDGKIAIEVINIIYAGKLVKHRAILDQGKATKLSDELIYK